MEGFRLGQLQAGVQGPDASFRLTIMSQGVLVPLNNVDAFGTSEDLGFMRVPITNIYVIYHGAGAAMAGARFPVQ